MGEPGGEPQHRDYLCMDLVVVCVKGIHGASGRKDLVPDVSLARPGRMAEQIADHRCEIYRKAFTRLASCIYGSSKRLAPGHE